jgi:hypothetical protein
MMYQFHTWFQVWKCRQEAKKDLIVMKERSERNGGLQCNEAYTEIMQHIEKRKREEDSRMETVSRQRGLHKRRKPKHNKKTRK